MRRYKALGLLAACLGVGASAQAAPHDLDVSQLGNPTLGANGYQSGAQGNFQAFALELGAGLAAAVLEPPNSLGTSGFAVNAELAVVNFARHSSTFRMPTEQPVSSAWVMPSLHVRKGFPFGVEAGAKVTWLDRSGLVAGTVEARWTLTEGGGYLPAVALRGYLTKLFGTPDFSLQTGGIDLSAGKRFPLAGVLSLTPYLGYGLGWTDARSGVIDFNRGRSAIAAQSGGAAEAYVDTAQYQAVAGADTPYNRVYVGGKFSSGVFTAGVECSLAGPGSFGEPLPDGTASTTVSRALPAIFALNSTVGLEF